MNAKKCDRCGKYYDVYFRFKENKDSKKIMELLNLARNGLCLAYNNEYTSKTLDLCPNCMEELLKWIDNQQVAGNL